MKPKVSVNLNKIYDNAKIVLNKCLENGVDVTAVTKLHGANPIICNTLIESGIKSFGDSRLDNLKNISNLECEKWLIRLPRVSEARQTVLYSDVSLNSQLETIKALNYEAKLLNKIHDVIIMVDLGDLREGYFNKKDLFLDFKEIIKLENINVKGIGTNLTCYGGILPTETNLQSLVQIKEELEKEFNTILSTVSGGNSTSYTLVRENRIPKGINNLRIGDTIYFGRDCSYRKHIEGMNKDAFILNAEIVEIKEKPSIPIGNQGMAALNTKPTFTDNGIRKRAILAVGKQDIDIDIFPLDLGISLLGSSSDHLLIDITDSKNNYKIGDKVKFFMYYTATLRAFTSKYINKEFSK